LACGGGERRRGGAERKIQHHLTEGLYWGGKWRQARRRRNSQKPLKKRRLEKKKVKLSKLYAQPRKRLRKKGRVLIRHSRKRDELGGSKRKSSLKEKLLQRQWEGWK